MKRRARRADGAPTVLLQGRVSPEARAEVQEAAERSGVSIAYYLEALIDQLVEDNGRLPIIASPRPPKEALPIPAARSEERSVGKGVDSTCRSSWSAVT